jgi:hypothetical protein
LLGFICIRVSFEHFSDKRNRRPDRFIR